MGLADATNSLRSVHSVRYLTRIGNFGFVRRCDRFRFPGLNSQKNTLGVGHALQKQLENMGGIKMAKGRSVTKKATASRKTSSLDVLTRHANERRTGAYSEESQLNWMNVNVDRHTHKVEDAFASARIGQWPQAVG